MKIGQYEEEFVLLLQQDAAENRPRARERLETLTDARTALRLQGEDGRRFFKWLLLGDCNYYRNHPEESMSRERFKSYERRLGADFTKALAAAWCAGVDEA